MKATMATSYEGIPLTRSDSKWSKTIVTSQDKMLDKLHESLTDRFQDVSEGLLCATKVVSFTNWPESADVAAGWFLYV